MSYGLKRKPTSIKQPKSECNNGMDTTELIRTSELDMADSVAPSDIDAVLTTPSWAIR